MSTSYDDLPSDILEQLRCLELELEEGDITMKGYEKKKTQLLESYKPSQPERQTSPVNFNEGVLEGDLDPEPSAADVTDFLDFLPSPTHSPKDKSGAEYMENFHQNNTGRMGASPRPQPQPQPLPQQQIPLPQQPVQQYQRPQNIVNRPVDPRYMPRPMYSNQYPAYPARPSFRPPQPMYRPPYGTPPVRPAPLPPRNGPMPPANNMAPFNHSRSPSLDSKQDYMPGAPFGYKSHAGSIRQSLDRYTESSDSDAQMNWRSNIVREPSTMSAPSRMNPSLVGGTPNLEVSPPIRRARSNRTRGRSRYQDSYMASTFKAIEPAPQPILSLHDPSDRIFLEDLVGRQSIPLKGRPIPFPLIDGSNQVDLTEFENLAQVLRYRGCKSGNRLNDAFLLVDPKGKESATITWDKLNAKAEKIAHQIREKGKLQAGDRVALIYRKSEVLDFIPALLGCFLAGVVAVPINAAEDLSELAFVLTLTNIHLILTTEHNQKAFAKDMQTKSVELPGNIKWWKTNDMGTWYTTKKMPEYPPIIVPDLAYIEYAKASNGELKGVTVSHKSIIEQCAAFQAGVTTTDITIEGDQVEVKPKSRRNQNIAVSYFEPRQQIGLILSVLHSIYAGNTMIFASGTIVDTPSVWIYVVSKYKATMAFADYPALKQITNYYQKNTKQVETFSKKTTPDLSSLKYLIVDTNTIDTTTNEYVAEKLLRPMGNTDNPLEVVCPVLSLPEHGGKILSMRDNLGPAYTEELVQENIIDESIPGSAITRPVLTSHSVLAPGNSRDVFYCLLDSKALRSNRVLVLAAGAEAKKAEAMGYGGTLIESFGFCMPNANVVIVDPDTATVCPPDTLGEIWVDSPSITGGFWGLSQHTESIFHAKPLIVSVETHYPETYNEPFLRTGLCGTIIGGRLFVLGTYEERVRQQRLGSDFGIQDTYFSNEILYTLSKRTHIDQCTIFEILVKDQHLPVLICESSASRSDLARVATEIDDALIEFHGLRVYAIIFVGSNGLPRQVIHGRKRIHALMAKRQFIQGQLNIRYIKIDVDRTIFNLAVNEDPSVKDVWHSGLGYDTAIRSGAIIPHPQKQHTGMEIVRSVADERVDYDLSRFTNIVDMLQWRASMYPEENAFVVATHAGQALNTKSYSWKKVSYKAATIAIYLSKKGIKRGAKIIVFVPFGIDYLLCIYACLTLGIVPVPIEPADPQQNPQRAPELTKLMVDATRDIGTCAIITNSNGDDILKNNIVKAAIRKSSPQGYKLPEIINVSKASKQKRLLGKESGIFVRPDWISVNRNSPAIITVQHSPDGRRYYAHLAHSTILNQCRTQKVTCQMRFQRCIVTTGLGTYDSLGLLHSVFCGVYVGCNTVLIPSLDFYTNPNILLDCLYRYKVKDVFVSNALAQFAMNRTNASEARHITLNGLQNMMVVNDSRPKPLLYQHMARYFSRFRLEKEAINTVYSNIGNPMVTTRSYMLIEPLTMLIDPHWLRQGIISILPPEDEAYGIILNDSGIVPSNTMIAIVNPDTHTLCPSNVMGEIWVSSDSNVQTFYSMDDASHSDRFEATIVGSDPNVKYMRTGDLGFLWNVRRRIDNRAMHPMLEEGQCLFVLGPMCENLQRNGLVHFPFDIEVSIERCHPAIPSGGSVVFQVEDEAVAVVSIKSSEYALSVVPLVVNAILENHRFLIDTVVIVHPSNLARSRFGEKMRLKAMVGYKEKKLTAIYVKRITNQHDGVVLPQWNQSQFSLADFNNETGSIYTHQAPSISELSIDPENQPPFQLTRRDTQNSRQSHSNSGSIHSSTVTEPMRH